MTPYAFIGYRILRCREIHFANKKFLKFPACFRPHEQKILKRQAEATLLVSCYAETCDLARKHMIIRALTDNVNCFFSGEKISHITLCVLNINDLRSYCYLGRSATCDFGTNKKLWLGLFCVPT